MSWAQLATGTLAPRFTRGFPPPAGADRAATPGGPE